MKRYKVCFNDGEIIGYYDTLSQTEAVEEDVFHRYISRYAVIYEYSPEYEAYVKL